MTEQHASVLCDAFLIKDPGTPEPQIHPTSIQDALWDELHVENRGSFPRWLQELCENHKSTWEANSKGGEPNHRQASDKEPLWI